MTPWSAPVPYVCRRFNSAASARYHAGSKLPGASDYLRRSAALWSELQLDKLGCGPQAVCIDLLDRFVEVVGDGVQLVVEQVPAEASDRRVYLDGQSLDILAFGRWSPMTKRLVDIDDSDLQAAQEALATRTIKDTVGQALRDAAAAAARRREIQRLTAGSLAGLADKEERAKLWP